MKNNFLNFLSFGTKSCAVLIVPIFLLVVNSTTLVGQIASWNPSGLSGYGPSPWANTGGGTNVAVGGLTRGTGMGTGGSPASNAWGGVCGTVCTTSAQAVTANQFATFTITPDATYKVSFSQLTLNYRRSGSGASSGELQYAINSGTYTPIVTMSFSSTSTAGGTIAPVTLSTVTALQNVAAGNTVHFRIALYNNSGNTGTWYVYNTGMSISGSVALPVELVDFSAKVSNNKAHISFSTASEQNNAFFSIERSTDGVEFRSIGKVNGAGNSTETRNYAFTDDKPAAGVNFYRLKQVDFDGKFEYSNIVSVTVGKTGNITLSPVPAQDQLHVNLETALVNDGSWQLLDNTGRLIQSGTIPAETFDFNVDVTTLTPGAYFLRMMDGQTVVTKQFQK